MSPPAPSRPVVAAANPRLLELGQLRVELKIGGRWRAVVQDVSLTLAAGQTVGIVGESGSGKSVTARSIARLLPPGARVAGEVRFDGEPVWAMNRARLRQFRAHDIGIIYQDPRAHVNTVHSIGDFLTEGVRDQGPRERRELAISALRAVGIPDPERRLKQYPHQLSGGLLQRVMIAAAIMPGPRLLLADEPTTALDVTTQSEVMAVLDEQRQARQLAMVFITHDLDLAAISFIGLGVQPPTAEWGLMVSEGDSALLNGYPYESLAAGAAIVLTVVAFNVLGERLAARSRGRQ